MAPVVNWKLAKSPAMIVLLIGSRALIATVDSRAAGFATSRRNHVVIDRIVNKSGAIGHRAALADEYRAAIGFATRTAGPAVGGAHVIFPGVTRVASKTTRRGIRVESAVHDQNILIAVDIAKSSALSHAAGATRAAVITVATAPAGGRITRECATIQEQVAHIIANGAAATLATLAAIAQKTISVIRVTVASVTRPRLAPRKETVRNSQCALRIVLYAPAGRIRSRKPIRRNERSVTAISANQPPSQLQSGNRDAHGPIHYVEHPSVHIHDREIRRTGPDDRHTFANRQFPARQIDRLARKGGGKIDRVLRGRVVYGESQRSQGIVIRRARHIPICRRSSGNIQN